MIDSRARQHSYTSNPLKGRDGGDYGSRMALTYVTDSRENVTGAGTHKESNIFDSKTQNTEAG